MIGCTKLTEHFFHKKVMQYSQNQGRIQKF